MSIAVAPLPVMRFWLRTQIKRQLYPQGQFKPNEKYCWLCLLLICVLPHSKEREINIHLRTGQRYLSEPSTSSCLYSVLNERERNTQRNITWKWHFWHKRGNQLLKLARLITSVWCAILCKDLVSIDSRMDSHMKGWKCSQTRVEVRIKGFRLTWARA